MSKYTVISTWKMSYDGVLKHAKKLNEIDNAADVVVDIVKEVENNPNYRSVGFGGLPNKDGFVELDAAFMDGKYLKFGAVMAVKNIKNPVTVAKKLAYNTRNNILASVGAERYALENNFEFQNMLTTTSLARYNEKLEEQKIEKKELEAYGGHDTVCVIGKGIDNNIYTAVSTSGLFMKDPGRVGDSPIIGSGFYADNLYGACCATGVGEDIMKGCLSFQVVNMISTGLSVQEACEKVLLKHQNELIKRGIKPGSMSVIAIDKDGNYGAATNKKEFPFVVETDSLEASIMVCQNVDGKIIIDKASQEWLDSYVGD